jgi:hypothetical protein
MFNVFFDTPTGSKKYCLCDMPLSVAKQYLEKFKARYLNADGSGRAYPNGKGYYPFSNPRIERV